MYEFKDKLNFELIQNYQKVSEEFRKEFNLEIDHKTNWLYWTNREKLDYLKKLKMYEIVNAEYVIAYKAVKSNYSSVFKPGLVYSVGNVYKAHCNCNSNISSSFGLSAWTFDEAKKYYSKGKILKVKIPIEKLGCITDDNKIRCFELEVLEEL